MTFIIGHWSVSRQVTSRHLSALNLDNVISLDGRPNEILPEEAFSWLVQHLSCEGDTLIDMDNDRASIFTVALKEGRNGVWITSQSSDVQQRLRLQTIFAQGPDVTSADSECESHRTHYFRVGNKPYKCQNLFFQGNWRPPIRLTLWSSSSGLNFPAESFQGRSSHPEVAFKFI